MNLTADRSSISALKNCPERIWPFTKIPQDTHYITSPSVSSKDGGPEGNTPFQRFQMEREAALSLIGRLRIAARLLIEPSEGKSVGTQTLSQMPETTLTAALQSDCFT